MKLSNVLESYVSDEEIKINFENRQNEITYRGMEDTGFIGKKRVRTSRAPRDTPPVVHEIIDEWFKINMNHNWRSNSVFAFKNYIQASSYVKNLSKYYKVYEILPTEQDPLCCYSENVIDLYSDVCEGEGEYATKYSDAMKEYKYVINSGGSADYQKNELADVIYDRLNELEYKVVRLSQVSPQCRSELMIKCDEYYYMKASGSR